MVNRLAPLSGRGGIAQSRRERACDSGNDADDLAVVGIGKCR
jgi:hypothetical protein